MRDGTKNFTGDDYKPVVREALRWRDEPMWRWSIWAVWWAAFLVVVRSVIVLLGYLAGTDSLLTGIEPGKVVTAFGTAGSLLLLAAGTMTICQTLLARLNGRHPTYSAG